MDVKRETAEMRTAERRGRAEGRGVALRVIAAIAVELIYAAVAFALANAELPFGAVCLSFAFLCAASGRHALSVAVGATLGALVWGSPVILLGAYAVTLCLRLSFCLMSVGKGGRALWEIVKELFHESAAQRAISASAGALAFGLYKLFESGFLYYHLFGTLIAVAVAAVGAALWRYLPDLRVLGSADALRGILRCAAVVSLMCAVTYSLRGIALFGISLSVFFAMLGCLLVTKRYGLTLGVTTALAVGLGVSATYAPLFVFGAVCYSLLGALSPLLGAVSVFAVGMWWGIYMDGIYALTPLAPALMAACLLCFAVDRLYLTRKERGTTEENSEKSDDIRHKAMDSEACRALTADEAVVRLDSASRLIKELCAGLDALSHELVGAENGGSEDMRRQSVDGELDAEIGELGVFITDPLYISHSHRKNGVKRTYAADTRELDGIGASVYSSERDRTEAAALELAALSDYLAGIMTTNEREFVQDDALAEKVSERLARVFQDLELRVSVFGARQKRVVVSADSRRHPERRAKELEREVSEVCGFRVDVSEPLTVRGETYITFSRRPVLRAEVSGRRRGAVGESRFCGDSIGAVSERGDGRLYAFISDGMGSGRDAALMSQMCVSFLRRLLPVGGAEADSVGKTLNMLNSFLRYRNSTSESECAATVDLGALDLIDCRVSFYKSGAAPTYIFRDGSLFKLRLRTVPVGIVKEPDIGRVSMELLPGDVIIMLSDGVTQGREECPELFEALRSRLLAYSAEGLADAVMDYTRDAGCTDDVSVVVVKIEDNL